MDFRQFFRKRGNHSGALTESLWNIGLMLAGISTAIASSPVALPAALVSIEGYAAVAGGVMSGKPIGYRYRYSQKG